MKQNTSIKEQSLSPVSPATSGNRQLQSASKETQATELDEPILMALAAAAEKKALNVVVLDLREIASFTDFFVIANGTNERQVQAISDEVVETLKKAGTPVTRVEGYNSAEWILLDYGDFVMHIFNEKARAFYDLERLWRESKRVALPPEYSSAAPSSLRSES
ncbi:MAG TPA: ribosome silencing factor [Pyrinomonadaceae bacterium]|nr:ribosome silencing factor [Pyrinomonadaceae bacterium]